MQRAQKIVYVVATVFATYALAGSAAAQEPQPQAPSRQKAPSDQEKMDKTKPSTGEAMAAELSLSATVEKVDVKKRQLTLKDDAGNATKIDVPTEAGDISAIKKGDKITIDYYSSVALQLMKPGPGKPGAEETTMAAKEPAKLPGGLVAKRISATVEVMKVDTANNTVTIKGPGGELDTIKVTDPDMQADLAKLKKGDKIKASYTQAVAVKVTPPEKGEKKMEPKKDY